MPKFSGRALRFAFVVEAFLWASFPARVLAGTTTEEALEESLREESAEERARKFYESAAATDPRCRNLLNPMTESEVTAFREAFRFRHGVWLEVPSDKQLKTFVSDLVAADLRAAKLPRAGFRFEVAFAEVFTNAVEHAHWFDKTRMVRLRIDVTDTAYVVTVEDRGGNFFDPGNAADSRNQMRARTDDESFDTDELARRRRGRLPYRMNEEGGRGVLISEGFSDRTIYEAVVDGGRELGTRVILTYNLPRPE